MAITTVKESIERPSKEEFTEAMHGELGLGRSGKTAGLDGAAGDEEEPVESGKDAFRLPSE
ncbi:MAG: hypothetical protein H7Z75_07840 [Ferruginibacter sp.]|nr:hypothetical protein [Cytophagales bacterium]